MANLYSQPPEYATGKFNALQQIVFLAVFSGAVD